MRGNYFRSPSIAEASQNRKRFAGLGRHTDAATTTGPAIRKIRTHFYGMEEFLPGSAIDGFDRNNSRISRARVP